MGQNKKIVNKFFLCTFFTIFTILNLFNISIMVQTHNNRKKTNIFKELSFEGKYLNFTDFYGENKTEIYKSIIELFEEFKVTKKKFLNLQISAEINNLNWDTEFTFKRDETIILTRDVIPYFESIEDYETCSKIVSLNKDLTCQ